MHSLEGSGLRVTTPAPRDVWRSILAASEEATACHAPEWLEAACAAGGFEDASRLYVAPGGRRLVLPLLRRPSRIPGLGTEWSFHGEWGHGGLVATGRLRQHDVATVLPDLVGPGRPRTIIKPGPFMDAAWRGAPAPRRVPHVGHVVELRGGFTRLWSSVFSRNTRYKIRRAEKEGVEIEWDSSGQLVDVHYDLHLRWTDRRARERGIPISAARTLARRRESLAVDRAVASRFRERCRVGIAWLANEPVASMIVLRTGAHANWWRSANDRERMGRTYATWLLLAQALEEAAAFGCEHFHMGESGGVASLMEFKEHFGGERRHYQELRFESALAATTVRLRDHAGSRAVKLAAWTAGLRRGSRE